MRLVSLFVGTVTVMGVVSVPLLGKPEEVPGGRTFAVTVTLISPADSFNAIGLTDLPLWLGGAG